VQANPQRTVRHVRSVGFRARGNERGQGTVFDPQVADDDNVALNLYCCARAGRGSDPKGDYLGGFHALTFHARCDT
jgi:hypothetical protein